MRWSFLCWFLVTACGSQPEENTNQPTAMNPSTSDSPSVTKLATDTSANYAKDTASYQTYTPAIKSPSGIYQFILHHDANTSILHTIAFYPGTFRLQEEYVGKKDSIVITEGTWAPSQGYIWLYKDQLVHGRFTWKGDTLQYYSPRLKNKFSLTKLTPASTNKVWMEKKKQGAVVFAVGTEPFWSVEVNKRDSIILSMPDWSEPLRVKVSRKNRQQNGIVYSGATDSLQVTILPYFCSDGMSDFIYTNKVTVNHKGKVYSGCGITF